MDKDLAISLAQDIRIDVEQIIREWWEMLILRDLFFSPIGNNLVFKGGTALRLAYGSPRFSEDLDFSVIKKFPFNSFKEAVLAIEKKYAELDMRDVADKFYTYIVQYRIREPWRPLALSVKIEISKRPVGEQEKTYDLANLKSRVSNIEALGNVVKMVSIYRDKIRALKTRNEPRDLFDLWYLSSSLRKPYNPPEEKFKKQILTRGLRKYLPQSYWKVIDALLAT